MRNLGPAFSTLSILGALGACLAGCPVWDGGAGSGSGVYAPDAGTVDTPVIPVTCTTNQDCQDGYCNPSSHQCVTSTSCAAGVSCPAMYTCDSRGVCVPGCSNNTQCASGQYCNAQSSCVSGCSADADCARVSPSLVCDTRSHQCAPSGACTTDAQCASTPATPVCLGGTCQAQTSVCQFDYQCTGSGQECVDGRCVVGCTAATVARDCAAGQVCTANRCAYPTSGACSPACPANQLCVTGACLATCTTDATCSTGFMCDHGVCRVDTRPRPFCTMDSQCNTDSICYHGACRRTCPHAGTGTDGGCMTVDVQFDLCITDTTDPMHRALCSSSSEQMPQCSRSAMCSAGHDCVNARCQ